MFCPTMGARSEMLGGMRWDVEVMIRRKRWEDEVVVYFNSLACFSGDQRQDFRITTDQISISLLSPLFMP